MRREDERLQDILDAIVAVERYAIQGKQAFEDQELIQVWIVHHFQIIGEAANALSPERLSRYPMIPWRQIIGLRNMLVHEYFRIDRQAMWDITESDLPPLKSIVEQMLQDFRDNNRKDES
jgi:uncharacterized protein with HEPN domain